MKKKVIFQINTTANVSSVGKDAEGISRAAIERGYESWIAYGDLSKKSSARLIRLGGKWPKIMHALKSRLLDAEGLSSKSSTKKLVEQMKVIKPDVVILHNIHGYYLNYPILFQYLMESNIPVIWSLHDCWAFTGHCTYFTLAECDKWKTECNHCPQRNTYPKSWFIDRSKVNYQRKKEIFCSLQNMVVVGVSDWLCGLVKDSFLGKYPVRRIYNGVRTETFTYRDGKKDKWPGKIVLLGCALRWSNSKGKGFYDYLKLASILSDEFLIVLVGHFDKPQMLASLPNNIVNIDRTEDQVELAEYYSRANVSLNLSYQETLGLTTIEAMACGTPGVVYNATASPELETSETGIVVPAGDVDAVYEAVKKILSKPKSYWSDACRKRAVATFDEIKQFSKYLDLFESVAKDE